MAMDATRQAARTGQPAGALIGKTAGESKENIDGFCRDDGRKCRLWRGLS
jgi:hypothetical protein